jgi:hypothetical protein
MKLIRDIDLEQMQDKDPKTEKLLNRVRLIWNKAPPPSNQVIHIINNKPMTKAQFSALKTHYSHKVQLA